ncbi:MAG: hypothetical protein AB7F32_12660, partial [Victivallaceae bacterium]
GAFSFLHRKKEKAQYVKVFVKDEGVRGRRKNRSRRSAFFKKFCLLPRLTAGRRQEDLCLIC